MIVLHAYHQVPPFLGEPTIYTRRAGPGMLNPYQIHPGTHVNTVGELTAVINHKSVTGRQFHLSCFLFQSIV